MNALVATNAHEIMESVIAKGDIAKLTPQERSSYYMQVCKSIGLNPLTRPFEYITLQGKMTLYARRDAADQLRKVNNISIEIVSKTVDEGILTIHVRAKDRAGRTDEDYGVVSVAGLKGEAAANAFLKAVTKAKRRVTLSISGLGFLDETEVEAVPGARVVAPVAIPHDPETGEITVDVFDDLRRDGFEQSSLGTEALKTWWEGLDKKAKNALKSDLVQWKQYAVEADKPAEIEQEEDAI